MFVGEGEGDGEGVGVETISAAVSLADVPVCVGGMTSLRSFCAQPDMSIEITVIKNIRLTVCLFNHPVLTVIPAPVWRAPSGHKRCPGARATAGSRYRRLCRLPR